MVARIDPKKIVPLGNQLTKTHQSEELEKYYFEDATGSYVIVDPARDADPNPRSYGVRVIVHCRSEVFAEEIEEEGLDVVHIITVSKCEKKNYASSTTRKKSARPAPSLIAALVSLTSQRPGSATADERPTFRSPR